MKVNLAHIIWKELKGKGGGLGLGMASPFYLAVTIRGEQPPHSTLEIDLVFGTQKQARDDFKASLTTWCLQAAADEGAAAPTDAPPAEGSVIAEGMAVQPAVAAADGHGGGLCTHMAPTADELKAAMWENLEDDADSSHVVSLLVALVDAGSGKKSEGTLALDRKELQFIGSPTPVRPPARPPPRPPPVHPPPRPARPRPRAPRPRGG